MAKELTPPDTSRCQAEDQVGAFVCGGRVGERTRCDALPEWIATEKQPGRDGQIGSMSLCERHREAMVDTLGAEYATFERVSRG